MTIDDFNPLAELMNDWYTSSLFTRLIHTYNAFTGLHFPFLHEDSYLKRMRPGILDVLLFPVFPMITLSIMIISFFLWKGILDPKNIGLEQYHYGLTLLFLVPCWIMTAFLSGFLVPISLLVEITRHALAILLTIALSPVIALVHGIINVQKKSMRKDIVDLVPVERDQNKFLYLNAPASRECNTSKSKIFLTELLFLDCDLSLPPYCDFRIYESADPLLLMFHFSFYESPYSSKQDSRSYLLNEKNSKGFAAFLKINGEFVEHLQNHLLSNEVPALETVQKMIKNPYDKLKLVREIKEIIAEAVNPPQSFELVFLPKNSPQNTINEVYAETSPMRIHPKLVLQLQDDEKAKVTWRNRPKEGGMQSVIIDNAAMPSGFKNNFPTNIHGFWIPKPLEISNTSEEHIRLIDEVKKRCVANTPALPQPATMDLEHHGAPQAILNLIAQYAAI